MGIIAMWCRLIARSPVAGNLQAGVAGAAERSLATLAPEGSAWHDLLVDIGQSWKKSSGGQVTCGSTPVASPATRPT